MTAPDQGDRGDLGARVREVLARVLCQEVPDVECDHVEGVLPCCERDAEALAPAVVTLMTEHAAEGAERAVGEALARVEAVCDEWQRIPGAWTTRGSCATDLRAALRAGGEGGDVPSDAAGADLSAEQGANAAAEGDRTERRSERRDA